MCGGRGTRLGGTEKPLRRIGGRPTIDRVFDALEGSNVGRVYAVTSPHAPRTAAHVSAPHIETAGDGYVADLQAALDDDRVSQPVLTAAADLPLLDATALDGVLRTAGGRTLTVAVPVGRVRALGFSVDTTTRHRGIAVRPAGINVVGTAPDRVWVTRDSRLAANVNRPGDLPAAAWHLARDGQSDTQHKG
jgi:adenosylcobinamide-phosphate guanylyltransferase